MIIKSLCSAFHSLNTNVEILQNWTFPTVSIDDKPVKGVIYLVLLKFINSGNIPIKNDEYERPITLNFGEKAKIITAEVYETYPENLKDSVKIEELRDELKPFIVGQNQKNDHISLNNTITLQPVLINSGESITLKILGTQIADDIIVNSRIEDLKEIRQKHPKRINDLMLLFILFVLGTISGFATFKIYSFYFL